MLIEYMSQQHNVLSSFANAAMSESMVWLLPRMESLPGYEPWTSVAGSKAAQGVGGGRYREGRMGWGWGWVQWHLTKS